MEYTKKALLHSTNNVNATKKLVSIEDMAVALLDKLVNYYKKMDMMCKIASLATSTFC